MKKCLSTLAIICATVLGTSAQAAPFTYAPKECDTEVTFPEKPFIENKCHGTGNERVCTDVVTYTKITPPEESLNVRVTCVAYDKKELDTYTPQVVETTLKRMLEKQNMKAFDLKSDDIHGVRRSTSLSVGSQDGVGYIYTGQIWIGKGSMFTIEAKISGPKNEDIEKAFADILRSTHAKGAVEKKPEPEPEKKEQAK